MVKSITELIKEKPSLSPLIKEIEIMINCAKPTKLWGGQENGKDLFYNPYRGDLEITFISDKEDFTYDYPLDTDCELVSKFSDADPTKELQFEDEYGEGGAIFVDDEYKVIAYIFNID
jgi:hypothetical protein